MALLVDNMAGKCEKEMNYHSSHLTGTYVYFSLSGKYKQIVQDHYYCRLFHLREEHLKSLSHIEATYMSDTPVEPHSYGHLVYSKLIGVTFPP
jgi:hypothetical protein